MKSFSEIYTYKKHDTEFIYDFLSAELIDDETGEVIMEGDWYHDHIEDMIEGFYECLKYLRVEFSKKTIDKNSDWDDDDYEEDEE